MKNTKIEWAHHTFNPWIGCTKVSPGCANCYAEAQDHRWGHDSWGPGKPRRRTSAANWRQPLRWNEEQQTRYLERNAGAPIPDRPRVFCASLADWLDEEVPVDWLADLLDLIRRTPCLDWLLLTKRPQNWRDRIVGACSRMLRDVGEPADKYNDDSYSLAKNWALGRPPANVWIGTTVENQAMADARIPALLQVPAKVRFLSCEPLLGRVEFSNVTNRADCVAQLGKPALNGIHWVICGGESGPKARPMHPHWARSLRDQCAAVRVPFFFKQWGEWTPGENLTRGGRLTTATYGCSRWFYATQTDKQSENCHADDSPDLYWVGKAAAGRLLDGREHNEFPGGAS